MTGCVRELVQKLAERVRHTTEATLLFVLDLILNSGGTQPHTALRGLDHHILDLTEFAPRDRLRAQLAHMDNRWRPEHRKWDSDFACGIHPRRRFVLLLDARRRLLARRVGRAGHAIATDIKKGGGLQERSRQMDARPA